MRLLQVLVGYLLLWSALARLSPNASLGTSAWSAFLLMSGIAWVLMALDEAGR